MVELTEAEEQIILDEIQQLDHVAMCRIWRFAPTGTSRFFATQKLGEAFKNRLFVHFGGFTPQISKAIGLTPYD